MKTLLNIRASLFGVEARSSQLADRFAARWLRRNPGGRVVTRELAPDSMPHLTAERYAAFNTPAGQRTPGQQAEVEFSDRLVAELEAADVILIAAPMYNFSVPATLRDYFDHIARAGVTFRYGTDGPQGLLTGKRTCVFITRGGRYPGEADSQIPYMRQFLGFIGLTDVEFVLAEGLAMGDDVSGPSLRAAERRIDDIERVAEAA